MRNALWIMVTNLLIGELFSFSLGIMTVSQLCVAFLHRNECGGVCGQVVNTSNSGSGGSGYKPPPSRCSLRRGTFLHFVSLHPGVYSCDGL